MNHYAGIDVSLEESSACAIDGSGKIVREGKVPSEPEALIAWFRSLGVEFARIGLEAGPTSQWLYAGMQQAGLPVELLETRHVRNAFKIMPVKTDRKDARGIAELIRLGWFRPVYCKSMEAQETRAMLTARKLVQKQLHETESSIRGILRGFGLKVSKTTPRLFEGRIRELVAAHQSLEKIADALLSVRSTLWLEFKGLETRLLAIARSDVRTRLLMTTPGVGVIVALTFASAIDDPSRFKSSKGVGPHFGLTPTRYQSGETDYSGRISKKGDGSVRTVLYEAAHTIIYKPLKGCTALKSWAMRLAKRAGRKKATVALARKLAIIMHRMLADGMPFVNQPA
ncbi:MAG TPA: IS110 family transposase [Xanthobacteraceae bacterium]|jgi:transposase